MGLIALAVAAWLLIAEEAAWIQGDLGSAIAPAILAGGVICLGLGLLIKLFSPVHSKLKRGRCVRCGAVIERGQSYCLDHLRETLNEYQDRSRERHMRRPGEMV
jgi:hypothetical protein